MASRVQVVGDWFHGRVPDGAVYAGRPAPGLPGSPWANPFKPGKPTPATVRLGGRGWPVPAERVGRCPADRAAARGWYRDLVHQAGLAGRIRAELAGSDVGCWCKPADPCHVDVLTAIANGERWWAVNGGTTMVSREEFIAELVAERHRRGITQTILATRIGVAQQSLSNWESGAVWPGRSNLAAWAAALDIGPVPGAVDPVRSECGTMRGYRIHGQRREPRCDPCKDINTNYIMIYRAARR